MSNSGRNLLLMIMIYYLYINVFALHLFLTVVELKCNGIVTFYVSRIFKTAEIKLHIVECLCILHMTIELDKQTICLSALTRLHSMHLKARNVSIAGILYTYLYQKTCVLLCNNFTPRNTYITPAKCCCVCTQRSFYFCSDGASALNKKQTIATVLYWNGGLFSKKPDYTETRCFCGSPVAFLMSTAEAGILIPYGRIRPLLNKQFGGLHSFLCNFIGQDAMVYEYRALCASANYKLCFQ